MPTTPAKITPRRVDFFMREDDHNTALFGSMGFSTKFIMRETGLSHSQVLYRLKKGGFTKDHKASRLDFRNGDSPFSAMFLNAAKSVVDGQLTKFLKKHL